MPGRGVNERGRGSVVLPGLAVIRESGCKTEHEHENADEDGLLPNLPYS